MNLLGLVLPWWTRWAALALALAAAATFGAMKMHAIDAKRYDALQLEYATFRTDVARVGAEAERRAKETEARYATIKETTDAENVRLRRANDLLSRSLHDARARGGYLPPAAPTADRPDRITFDRAELDGALRRLDAGVQELIDEGGTARLNLDTAIRWAADIRNIPAPDSR